MAFSHRGRLLASGARDGRVVLYDVVCGQRRVVVRDTYTGPDAHSDAIAALAWRPDDSLLATGSADKLVQCPYPL